jgi:hypothetical protein
MARGYTVRVTRGSIVQRTIIVPESKKKLMESERGVCVAQARKKETFTSRLENHSRHDIPGREKDEGGYKQVQADQFVKLLNGRLNTLPTRIVMHRPQLNGASYALDKVLLTLVGDIFERALLRLGKEQGRKYTSKHE